jgi:hypothetical protein
VKFWSKYSNARYTVNPTYNEMSGPHRRTVYGLHAQFTENAFDTEVEQEHQRWTDEQREEVEMFLQNHYDFGKTLNLQDAVLPGPEILTRNLPECSFRIVLDGGEVDVCGRVAVSDDGLCAKHALLVDTPKSKPNRAKAESSA